MMTSLFLGIQIHRLLQYDPFCLRAYEDHRPHHFSLSRFQGLLCCSKGFLEGSRELQIYNPTGLPTVDGRVPAITTGWMFVKPCKIMGIYSPPTDPTGEFTTGNLRDPSFRPDCTTSFRRGEACGKFPLRCGETTLKNWRKPAGNPHLLVKLKET